MLCISVYTVPYGCSGTAHFFPLRLLSPRREISGKFLNGTLAAPSSRPYSFATSKDLDFHGLNPSHTFPFCLCFSTPLLRQSEAIHFDFD